MRAGDRIGAKGRYRIVDRLGEGGMGTVWRARDDELQRPVAIKLLLDTHADRPEAQARLAREARILAALRHPNLVGIYDAQIEETPAFLVLELLTGRTLAERLDEGPMSRAELLPVLAAIAAALAHLHERGIIHRDVKPQNVFLCEDGTCKLMDFGLARPDDVTPLTLEGALVGTLFFSPPEIFRGARADPRADVYQLGIVGGLAATGRHLYPVPREAQAFFAYMLREDWPRPERPEGFDPSLWELILRMGSRDPARRPADGAACLAGLERIRAGVIDPDGADGTPSGRIGAPSSPSVTGRRSAVEDDGAPHDSGPDPLARKRRLAWVLSVLAVLSVVLRLVMPARSRPSSPVLRAPSAREKNGTPRLANPAVLGLRWPDPEGPPAVAFRAAVEGVPGDEARLSLLLHDGETPPRPLEIPLRAKRLPGPPATTEYRTRRSLGTGGQGRFARLAWTLSLGSTSLASGTLETVSLRCMDRPGPRSQAAMADEILDGVLIDPSASNQLSGRIALHGNRAYGRDEAMRIYAFVEEAGRWRHDWIWPAPGRILSMRPHEEGLDLLVTEETGWSLRRLLHASCRDAFAQGCRDQDCSPEALLAGLRSPPLAGPVALDETLRRDRLALLLARPAGFFPSELLARGDADLTHGRILLLPGRRHPVVLAATTRGVELLGRGEDMPSPGLLRGWSLVADALEAPPLAGRWTLAALRRDGESGLALLDGETGAIDLLLRLPAETSPGCGAVLVGGDGANPFLVLPLAGPDRPGWFGPHGLCRLRLRRARPLSLVPASGSPRLEDGEELAELDGQGERLWPFEGRLVFPRVLRERTPEGAIRPYARRLSIWSVDPLHLARGEEIAGESFVVTRSPPVVSLLQGRVLHVSAGARYGSFDLSRKGQGLWRLPYYRRPRRPFVFAGPGRRGELLLPEAKGLLVLPFPEPF